MGRTRQAARIPRTTAVDRAGRARGCTPAGHAAAHAGSTAERPGATLAAVIAASHDRGRHRERLVGRLVPVVALLSLAGCGASPPPNDLEADGDHDSIASAADACPSDSEDHDGFEDDDGCPEPDDDGDRVADVDEACPRAAEDLDGFEDGDGCPDPDDDGDRIADTCDRCPLEPEIYNGACDEDGCPDHGAISLVEETVTILDRIRFRRGSSSVADADAPALDAVAALLLGSSGVEVVAIVGHARRDEREREALARARAEAVLAALLQRGVAPEALLVEVDVDDDPGDAAATFDLRRYGGRAWRDGHEVETPLGPATCSPVPGCDPAVSSSPR